MLNAYELRKKIIAYVKDERFNLNIMTLTLKFVVSCDVLGLEEKFQGTFNKPFIKACQYATIDEKICKCLRSISIKAFKEIYRSA